MTEQNCRNCAYSRIDECAYQKYSESVNVNVNADLQEQERKADYAIELIKWEEAEAKYKANLAKWTNSRLRFFGLGKHISTIEKPYRLHGDRWEIVSCSTTPSKYVIRLCCYNLPERVGGNGHALEGVFPAIKDTSWCRKWGDKNA